MFSLLSKSEHHNHIIYKINLLKMGQPNCSLAVRQNLKWQIKFAKYHAHACVRAHTCVCVNIWCSLSHILQQGLLNFIHARCRPHHSSGNLLLASHCAVLHLIPHQPTWDLWWMKWHYV